MDIGLVERVARLLAVPHSGLVTDIDGTISPIVALPEQAQVDSRARTALAGLRDEVGHVAVVSGRTAADARRLVDLDGVIYVGNHGLEIDGQVVPEARPWVARVASVVEDLREHISEPGIIIENKGATASVHYRLTSDPQKAHAQLLEVLATCALTSGLRFEEGRMVVNLLPPLRVTKGSAVTWLARDYGLSTLVYLGDDVTDAHAFQALKLLHGVKTLAVGVVGPETPLIISQLADASVPSVAAVADLLCAVLERLRAGGTMIAGVPSTVRSETHGQQSTRAYN